MRQKKPFIVLTGPTAVGKTELSIALAKAIGGEIISADSMQVYKHMDIGSAKIRKDQMQGVAHYLIDILEPTEAFDVVKFLRLAQESIEIIYSHGHIPILVGGTGFYIQAVLYNIDFTENEEDHAYRRQLEQFAVREGKEAIHELLRQTDVRAADAIHPNNVKRVIRALEFHEKTGMLISEHNEAEHQKESPYDFRYFVLNDNRDTIYANIDNRVDLMIELGLVDEVKKLKGMGCKRDSVAMQGLGYKEILAYLEGENTLEEAVYMIKRDTRHFAKRQLTWFRRETEVLWVDKEAFGHEEIKILEYMIRSIQDGRNTNETNVSENGNQ